MQSDTEIDANQLQNNNLSESEAGLGSEARVVNVSECSAQSGNLPKFGGGAPKWGNKLLGRDKNIRSPDCNAACDQVDTEDNSNNIVGDELKVPDMMPPRSSMKPLSKWGRMIAKQQDTIAEEDPSVNGEEAEAVKSNLQKSDSTDSGILKSDIRLDQIAETSFSPSVGSNVNMNALSTATGLSLTVTNIKSATSTTSVVDHHDKKADVRYPNVAVSNTSWSASERNLSLGGLNKQGMHDTSSAKERFLNIGSVEQQVVHSLDELRLNIRDEIRGINARIGRLDEQMSELLRLFTPSSSSPCSSGTNFPPSKHNSPNSNSSGNMSNTAAISGSGTNTCITSPTKNSLSSSPRNRNWNSSHPIREESVDTNWNSMENVHASGKGTNAPSGEQFLNIEVLQTQKQTSQSSVPPAMSQPTRDESMDSNLSERDMAAGKPDSPTSNKSSKSSNTSRKSIPNEGKDNHSSSHKTKSKFERKKNEKGKEEESKFEETDFGGRKMSDEEENIPFKDKDLDIM